MSILKRLGEVPLYKAKLELSGGDGGAKQKKPFMGGVWIFSGTAKYVYRPFIKFEQNQ